MADAETNRMEYKRELDEGGKLKLEKAVVSFLNYSGGDVLVGVEDDGTVVGVTDLDGDQRKIADRLANNIRPNILGLFDIVAEKRNGKDIIRIVISGGPQKPYYLRKRGMTEDGCFIRVGSSAQPMNEAMIERLLSQRQTSTLSTTAVSRQNLTFEQLHIYYNEHGLTLNEQFEENLELRNGDGAYNFLAYLLADSNGASLKVAKYAGPNKIDLIENEEYGYRCLITAVYRVLDKLDVENRTFAKITSRNRLERKLINAVALREAFINAVVHNDYSLGWPVVELFSDRLTITSVGGLVPGLSLEDFFNGRSILRNRELMRVFKDVELVEGLGSGMQRILAAYGRSAFEITPGFIVVTFPYSMGFDQNEDKSGETSLNQEMKLEEKNGTNLNEVWNETLSETELKKVLPLLDLIKNRGVVSPIEAREALGRSKTTIWRYLNLLCERGIVESTGNTSAVTYRLKTPESS